MRLEQCADALGAMLGANGLAVDVDDLVAEPHASMYRGGLPHMDLRHVVRAREPQPQPLRPTLQHNLDDLPALI